MRGILDRTARGQHVGCPQLKSRIAKLPRLRLHVCGHIHEAYGNEERDGVAYVNASNCNLHYEPTQPPVVVELGADGVRVEATIPAR